MVYFVISKVPEEIWNIREAGQRAVARTGHHRHSSLGNPRAERNQAQSESLSWGQESVDSRSCSFFLELLFPAVAFAPNISSVCDAFTHLKCVFKSLASCHSLAFTPPVPKACYYMWGLNELSSPGLQSVQGDRGLRQTGETESHHSGAAPNCWGIKSSVNLVKRQIPGLPRVWVGLGGAQNCALEKSSVNLVQLVLRHLLDKQCDECGVASRALRATTPSWDVGIKSECFQGPPQRVSSRETTL